MLSTVTLLVCNVTGSYCCSFRIKQGKCSRRVCENGSVCFMWLVKHLWYYTVNFCWLFVSRTNNLVRIGEHVYYWIYWFIAFAAVYFFPYLKSRFSIPTTFLPKSISFMSYIYMEVLGNLALPKTNSQSAWKVVVFGNYDFPIDPIIAKAYFQGHIL